MTSALERSLTDERHVTHFCGRGAVEVELGWLACVAIARHPAAATAGRTAPRVDAAQLGAATRHLYVAAVVGPSGVGDQLLLEMLRGRDSGLVWVTAKVLTSGGHPPSLSTQLLEVLLDPATQPCYETPDSWLGAIGEAQLDSLAREVGATRMAEILNRWLGAGPGSARLLKYAQERGYTK